MVLEIPLKSGPQVSVAPPLDNAMLIPAAHWPRTSSRTPVSARPDASAARNDGGSHYKLARTYSETETNNFDADTGHRLYDDGRIRPRPSRASSPTGRGRGRDASRPPSLYTRSHSSIAPAERDALRGIEDEYIPGLDFGDVLSDWNPGPGQSDHSAPASRDVSYLDLQQLHAQVAPQPIQARGFAPSEDPRKKKFKATPDGAGAASFEAVLASLPANFSDLPYSQRRRMVKEYSDAIDYAQFSQFARSVASGSAGSGGRSLKSDPASIVKNGSFLRRSRRNSVNTVAGRLLALSSSSDLKRLDTAPKRNVDEKGALVLNHQLGKVIGFGAWGIIRECTSATGLVRAVKIVKSTKVSEHSETRHNPKVLRVFRKEIEIWRQLDHPHILPLLDSCETEHMIFCLTNRVNGGTLFDLVARWGHFDEGVAATSGPIKYSVAAQRSRLATTAKCARQVVEAMRYMHHELGIVHGDLKLENVLVEEQESHEIKMILCDFGMSRVFNPRLGRAVAGESASPASRSKSSLATIRRPYEDADSANTRPLFSDDSKLGISQLFRPSGLCSVSLSGSRSDANLSSFHEFKNKSVHSETESGLPHSHIGSLPYASPELLSPSPPPLGPSADVWALGVLLYTMAVGRLPFQHPYEPRLRAEITAGKINRRELRQSTLLASVIDETLDHASSMVDMARQAAVQTLRQEWLAHDASEFEWFEGLVECCMERDITRRWDLPTVSSTLAEHV